MAYGAAESCAGMGQIGTGKKGGGRCHMTTFGVRVHGEEMLLRFSESKWFGLRRRSELKRHGFYRTRFVDAATPQEAAEKAEALVWWSLRSKPCVQMGLTSLG